MILVTGGTGLVGSHLLYKLIENGNKVKATYRSKKKIEATKHVFHITHQILNLFFLKLNGLKQH